MLSDNESVFTDADGDEDPAPRRGEGRKRQRSMLEMLDKIPDRESKKGRRRALGTPTQATALVNKHWIRSEP